MKRAQLLALLGCGSLVAGSLAAVVLTRAVHAQKEGKPVPSSLPDLQPNKDWRPVGVNKEKGVDARAWSDAAAGCHLALFELAIPKSAAREKIFENLNKTMATSDYQLTESEVEMNPPRLNLEGFGVRGIATLALGEGENPKASLLACYWNGREVSYCRSLCEAADDKMRATAGAQAAEKGP